MLYRVFPISTFAAAHILLEMPARLWFEPTSPSSSFLCLTSSSLLTVCRVTKLSGTGRKHQHVFRSRGHNTHNETITSDCLAWSKRPSSYNSERNPLTPFQWSGYNINPLKLTSFLLMKYYITCKLMCYDKHPYTHS